jgi:hypothetical protein
MDRAKMERRVREAEQAVLEPGEEHLAYVYGQAVPRGGDFWIVAALGPLAAAFFQRPRLLVVTDRRVLVFKSGWLALRPGSLVFAGPRAGVTVLRYKPGRLIIKLALQLSGEKTLRLKISFRFRAEAEAVHAALAAEH